jgi:hypothetical protein
MKTARFVDNRSNRQKFKENVVSGSTGSIIKFDRVRKPVKYEGIFVEPPVIHENRADACG